MKQSIILLGLLTLLSACGKQDQTQRIATEAFNQENQLWNELGVRGDSGCPKAVNGKTQLARQECLEFLAQKYVRPNVLYPDLVDYMLTRIKNETRDYADGKISRKKYTQNINIITSNYWDYWRTGSGIDIANVDGSSPYQGIGDALLIGIQTTGQVLQNHQQTAKENAESNKPMYCTSYGNNMTCNRY